MQPITINPVIISDLMKGWNNPNSQRNFHKLVENLEQFHQVYIDKTQNGSNWLNNFRDIRNSITDFNVKKLFDDLIGPRNIKYVPIKIDQSNGSLLEVTSQTPDKIGLDVDEKWNDVVKYYNLVQFNSIVYDTQNYLFRVPKTITFLPGEEFGDLRLISPYIRNAFKIEFCDPFLFKNPKYEDDAEFIFDMLKLCKNIKEIEIHCDPNPLNVLQKKVETRIKKEFGKKVFNKFIKYNSANKNVNHDRFIIINHDQISIRFTTSFNNLRRIDSGRFRAFDSFLIEFSSGRKYYN